MRLPDTLQMPSKSGGVLNTNRAGFVLMAGRCRGAPSANTNPGALWSHRGASELIVSVDDDERENPPIKLRIRVNKTESTIDVTIGK